VVISSDVGLRKPDAVIYELILDPLGMSATGAVVIDDAEPNVAGAMRVGTGLVHLDAARTRPALCGLVPRLRALRSDAEDGLGSDAAPPGRWSGP
jgi:FMN phosphatase YigB (HAD superfamily)